MEERLPRKLAAILYADVAGYSRLTGEDEDATHRMLSEYLNLISSTIESHRGQVMHYAGDAVLAKFDAVVDAMSAAVAIQNVLETRNQDLPDDRKVQFRIGVNSGDVIEDRGDIYGDGVNVAARLESLAEPGGVCISDAVRSAVGKKLDLAYDDMGEQEVKNITEPVRAYRVLRESTAFQPISGARPTDKPSIAVLPFENFSGDAEQDYFADGVTEEIITALSQIRWFFVIARNSTFAYKGSSVDVRKVAQELGVRYVLEGSVRKAGNRVRVTAQLIDGDTGKHVWAHRYERDFDDVFALQDELTETIVGVLEPELGKAERARAKAKRPENLDAWDLYQRGLSHLYRYTREELAEAQELFRRAAALDPGLGSAHSALAEAYYFTVTYGYSNTPEEDRETALAAARTAVELDDDDASAHCMLGMIHYLRRGHELAVPELEKALELNPNSAWAHYGLGASMVFSGRALEAIPCLETAIRLSPRDAHMGSFLVRMADAHFFMHRYEEAVEWAKKALQQPAFQWSRYAVLLSALGHLGRLEEADRFLGELRQRRADFSIEFVQATYLAVDPDHVARYHQGLRKVGVS
jgi:TolB-like protein/Flp pilus assembly protein TadD